MGMEYIPRRKDPWMIIFYHSVFWYMDKDKLFNWLFQNRLHFALGMNQYLTVAVSLPDDIKNLNFEFK